MPAANTQLTLRINVALSPAAARRLDGLAAAAGTTRRAVIQDALHLLAWSGDNADNALSGLIDKLANKYAEYDEGERQCLS